MAKNWNLGDIVPPERKVAKRTREGEPPARARGRSSEYRESESREKSATHPRGRAKKMGAWLIAGAVGMLAILGIIGSSMLLDGADVTVYPKYRDISVDRIFTAKREPTAGELGYELLSLQEEAEHKVAATGQEEVKERARGKITIYNGFSTGVQRLIKNTRFESQDGLIFRISESVDVPGYKKAADGSVVPGSIEAEVFADGSGDRYNIAPTRFVLPGLTGEQHEKIYAQSASVMTGGFEGMKYIVGEKELNGARSALEEELKTKLTERLANERPAGFVLYDSSIVFSYEPLPSTDAGDQMVNIKLRGHLTAPLFKDDAFAGEVAKTAIDGYGGEPMRIENPTSLDFEYTSTSTSDVRAASSVGFRLHGPAKIVWTYDQEKLRNDLKKTSKAALPLVLSGYPAIETAKATVKPFWKSVFPDDITDIRITESTTRTE